MSTCSGDLVLKSGWVPGRVTTPKLGVRRIEKSAPALKGNKGRVKRDEKSPYRTAYGHKTTAVYPGQKIEQIRQDAFEKVADGL